MAKWSCNDDLLALDLYFRAGRKVLSIRDSKLIEVSELIEKPEGAVRMKMQNYQWIDPERSGGLSNASQQSKDMWRKFASDEQGLRIAAKNIRRKHGQM